MRDGIIIEVPEMDWERLEKKPEMCAYEVYQRHLEMVNQMQEEESEPVKKYDHIVVYVLVAMAVFGGMFFLLKLWG